MQLFEKRHLLIIEVYFIYFQFFINTAALIALILKVVVFFKDSNKICFQFQNFQIRTVPYDDRHEIIMFFVII
jgi:hypothetical protein